MKKSGMLVKSIVKSDIMLKASLNLVTDIDIHILVIFTMESLLTGIKLIDMCEQLEECNRRLVKENGLQVQLFYVSPHLLLLISSCK
jgi:hypothetical protein